MQMQIKDALQIRWGSFHGCVVEFYSPFQAEILAMLTPETRFEPQP